MIEGSAGVLSPDKAAQALLKGIDKNQYHITADLVSEFIRMSMNGKISRRGKQAIKETP
jgi:hypothetical protein